MGSTGSIGTQTLDIARAYPDRFPIKALSANTNWQLLANQALEFHPEMVVIENPDCYKPLCEALHNSGVRVECGEGGRLEAVTLKDVEIVVGAMVGYSGLPSTVAALQKGKTLALANKETLVVAGEIITRLAKEYGTEILPVDSEHSAIFQCLHGENPANVSSIILTASGGPFRKWARKDIENATPSQALKHPNWEMGAKVTVDSASMMNKGFEMIEASWLFDRKPQDIRVAVHPESIVHSMVEFEDGSIKAQLGTPDMRIPIEVALGYPGRLGIVESVGVKRLGIAELGTLTFERPDMEKFPLLQLAYDVADKGGLLPAVMNAANEVAVAAFLHGEIPFGGISRLVTEAVEKGDASDFIRSAEVTLENIASAHKVGTDIADRLIKAK